MSHIGRNIVNLDRIIYNQSLVNEKCPMYRGGFYTISMLKIKLSSDLATYSLAELSNILWKVPFFKMTLISARTAPLLPHLTSPYFSAIIINN